ncbi:MAG: hypothetical protein K8T26_11730 [Lentisphaerae bacterium]|nr:hypothetical protein [Lentisphaerota bacterium]
MMTLSAHIERVVGRARAFYGQHAPGHYLINASIPAPAPAVPPLSDFDLDRQLTEWLDLKLEAARPKWHVKEGLDDDAIPSICPTFGIAEHSAWLGMEVRLQETTCLPVPLLESPEQLSTMRLSPDARWFGYMRDGYRHLRARADGTYVTSVRGILSPMDMANAVRGDDLFTDFLLNPEFVHRLMEFLMGAIPWYYKQLCGWADTIAGGHVFHYGSGWMPPQSLGHLSNDAAMLCASSVYAEFGFPYEARLTGSHAAALYHVHNEKMHYVPQLATLPNLRMLEVTHDPKTKAPIEDLDRILGATGSANLMLLATSDQIRAQLGGLAGRNVFFQAQCRDRADADDLVQFVRDRSKPLA